MTGQFDDFYERLYRAVYPPDIMPLFWNENGELSSAVFKDKNGLSVERADGRNEVKLLSQSQCKHLARVANVVYQG